VKLQTISPSTMAQAASMKIKAPVFTVPPRTQL
jgi:hypothetical protein